MIFDSGKPTLIVQGSQVYIPYEYIDLDADASTLIAAMTSTPDATRQTLISDTITDLKAAGIWTLLDDIWFMAAHDSQAALLGWKRYKDLTLVNSPTFTADRGYAGNASTSYIHTNFVPSTDGVNYAQNSASFGIYIRTTSNADVYDMGCEDSANVKMSVILARSSTAVISRYRINQSSTGEAPVQPSAGFHVTRRSAFNALQGYRNGSSVHTDNATSAALSTFPFFIGALNRGGTPVALSARQYAAAFIGSSLTTGQQGDLYTIVQAYMTAVGANV